MNILVLNHYERLSPRVYLEAITLKKYGYNIDVVHWCRKSSKCLPFGLESQNFNVSFIDLAAPYGTKKLIFKLPQLYSKIFSCLKNRQFNVIHCTQLFLLPISISIAKNKGAKIVYDAYDRYAIDYAYNYLPRFQNVARIFFEKLENMLIRHVDSILTVSTPDEFLAKRYQKYCRNVQILFNVPSIDLKIDSSKISFLRRSYKNFYIITYVGGLYRNNGIFLLPDVLSILTQYSNSILLLLIGSFEDSVDRDYFLKKIEEYKLVKYVRIIDWLPYTEMFHYLKISNVGLALFQPGKHCSMIGKYSHRKLFTYMQAGIPIISSNFGEVGKIVEEESCGILVDTSSPQEIADAIIYLLNNPDKAQMMGQNGRRAIEEKYNWDKESKKLIKLYKDILK